MDVRFFLTCNICTLLHYYIEIKLYCHLYHEDKKKTHNKMMNQNTENEREKAHLERIHFHNIYII
jgi:hypothetical protein